MIVNPANERLQHNGGAARAIAIAAGKELEDECEKIIRQNGTLRTSDLIHTTSGKLSPPIRYVLHAVGPYLTRERTIEECEQLLKKIFNNCLMYANSKLDAKSIAIPAISSG